MVTELYLRKFVAKDKKHNSRKFRVETTLTDSNHLLINIFNTDKKKREERKSIFRILSLSTYSRRSMWLCFHKNRRKRKKQKCRIWTMDVSIQNMRMRNIQLYGPWTNFFFFKAKVLEPFMGGPKSQDPLSGYSQACFELMFILGFQKGGAMF